MNNIMAICFDFADHRSDLKKLWLFQKISIWYIGSWFQAIPARKLLYVSINMLLEILSMNIRTVSQFE